MSNERTNKPMSRIVPDVVARKISTEAMLSMHFLYEYLADNVKSVPVPSDVVCKASEYVFAYLTQNEMDQRTIANTATLFAGAFVLAAVDRKFGSCLEATGSEKADELVYEVRDLVRAYPKMEVDLYAHMHHDAVRRIIDASSVQADDTTITGNLFVRLIEQAEERARGIEKRKPGRPRKDALPEKRGMPWTRLDRDRQVLFRDYLLSAVDAAHQTRPTTRKRRLERCPNGFYRHSVTKLCTDRKMLTFSSQGQSPLVSSSLASPEATKPDVPFPLESPLVQTPLVQSKVRSPLPKMTRRRCPNGHRRVPAKTGVCTKKTGGSSHESNGLSNEDKVEGGGEGENRRYFFSRSHLQAVHNIGIWKCVCVLYPLRLSPSPNTCSSRSVRFLSALPESYQWNRSVIHAVCAGLGGETMSTRLLPVACIKFVVGATIQTGGESMYVDQ